MTLSLSNITKSFGSIEVLKNITTLFEPGTVTAIVGDNGAGKSTLLKTLAGIHKPDHGSIVLNGHDITALASDTHRQTGIEMVMQDLALAKQQDVVTNLFMGREITNSLGFLKRRHMAEETTTELKKLGINIPDIKKPVGLLSGGQQQAIAIARAAMFYPHVLLLDEPTAALAAREVEQVLTLIRQERAKGRIIILVSHRLNDVFAVADRIIVLKHGEIYADTAVNQTSLTQIVEQIVS